MEKLFGKMPKGFANCELQMANSNPGPSYVFPNLSKCNFLKISGNALVLYIACSIIFSLPNSGGVLSLSP